MRVSCKPQLTKGIVNAVGWCVENRIIYAQEAIINCSCDTLNWLKNQIGLFKKEAQLNSIWDEIENNDGVYLVPAFVGLSVLGGMIKRVQVFVGWLVIMIINTF